MGLREDEIQRSAVTSRQLEEGLTKQYEELSARAVQHRERAELLQRMADQANAQAVNDERLLDELAEPLAGHASYESSS